MKKIILSVISISLLFSMVSALVNCDSNIVSLNYDEGEIPLGDIIITSCSSTNSTSINFDGDSYISQGSDMNTISGTKNLRINIDESITSGDYYPIFSFGDGSTPVYVNININELDEDESCSISIFPTIMSNIKIIQGELKTRNIQLSVPSCYTSEVTVNGIALLSDTKPLQLGELSLGSISPGSSVIIPIELDAIGVSTGTYSDILQFLLYDDLGNKINVPQVSISVLVSQGIQPINNFTLNDLPICSLDAIDMSLNSSQKLTCSSTNPNIEIRPLIDSKYIRGLSVSETSSQYIYTFQPILIGTSSIGAEFVYKNAPLGSPFLQEIRISPSGNTPLGGITTRIDFYQKDIKKNLNNLLSGETIIRVIDNKTGNILNDFNLYLNGILTNTTVYLETDKVYELRTSTPGYLDSVINFNVTRSEISLTISPEKTFYKINDELNLTCSVENCTYLLDEVIINSPYRLRTSGEKVLKVLKEGYETLFRNISVRNIAMLTECSPIIGDWSSRDSVLCDLDKPVNWTVYKDSELIANGDGSRLEFKMEGEGFYEIKSDLDYIYSKQIEQESVWYNPLSWEFVKNLGWWWILIIGLGGGIIYFIFFKEDKVSENIGFGANVGV